MPTSAPKPKAKPICKTRACIVEDAGTVHPLKKGFGYLLVGRQDTVGVATAVAMNVLHSRIQAIHHTDRGRQFSVLDHQRVRALQTKALLERSSP